MLKNLAEAKEFAVEKIEEIVEDKLSDREKDLIEFKIEDDKNDENIENISDMMNYIHEKYE